MNSYNERAIARFDSDVLDDVTAKFLADIDGDQGADDAAETRINMRKAQLQDEIGVPALRRRLGEIFRETTYTLERHRDRMPDGPAKQQLCRALDAFASGFSEADDALYKAMGAFAD